MHLKIREHSGRCRYVAWIRRHRYVPCMLIMISSIPPVVSVSDRYRCFRQETARFAFSQHYIV